MQKVTPFLWFDDKAEEAAEFYVDVFNGRPGGSEESKVQASRATARTDRARPAPR